MHQRMSAMHSGKALTNAVFRFVLVLVLPAIMLLIMVKGLEVTNHINLPVVDVATQVIQQDGKPTYREVALPHNYTLGSGFSYGQYSLVLPKAGGDTTAILLPPFRDTLVMRTGGELIWQTAPVAYSREHMMPRFRYQPVYHELPNRLFNGENLSVSIDIGSSGGLRLPQIYVGTPEEVKPVYHRQYWSQIGVHKVMLWLTPVITLFYLMLWWFRRQNSEYLYFALGTVCWAMTNMTFTISNLPISQHIYWMLSVSFQPLLTLFMVLFLHRWYGIQARKLEYGFWRVSLLLVVASFVLYEWDPQYIWWRFNESFLRGFVALSAVYIGYILLWQACLRHSLSALILAISGLVGVYAGVLDSLDGMQLLDMYFPLSIHANLLIFLTLCGLLMYRYVSALNKSEELQKTLEDKVVEAVKRFEQEQSIAHESEKQRALLTERQNLLSDMHDGLGSQLVELITLLRVKSVGREDLQLKAQQCLNDLRLILDSRNPLFETQFTVLLGQWRSRIEPVLEASGIDLVWSLDICDEEMHLSAQQKLDLLRVFQELITNTIKHAKDATRVMFCCQMESNSLHIQITDDGKCSEEQDDSDHGYGLASIQSRVKRLGGQCHFQRGTSGASTEMIIPTGKEAGNRT
ncbi:histidine kinase [Grimontia kaedaensis]|uniref:histidine kinase n=1 Tax=Grimontia kaedaensis TaxID=2872157 RepID=A0ABY4X100_9GAMM|nr:ATP-binding protein [Grimontia kaedaensis]USH04929.1 histidine kinase [Grimontia kaedaensis]